MRRLPFYISCIMLASKLVVALLIGSTYFVGKIGGIDSAGTALVSTEIDSTKSSTGLMGPVGSTGRGNPVESTPAPTATDATGSGSTSGPD